MAHRKHGSFLVVFFLLHFATDFASTSTSAPPCTLPVPPPPILGPDDAGFFRVYYFAYCNKGAFTDSLGVLTWVDTINKRPQGLTIGGQSWRIALTVDGNLANDYNCTFDDSGKAALLQGAYDFVISSRVGCLPVIRPFSSLYRRPVCRGTRWCFRFFVRETFW